MLKATDRRVDEEIDPIKERVTHIEDEIKKSHKRKKYYRKWQTKWNGGKAKQ